MTAIRYRTAPMIPATPSLARRSRISLMSWLTYHLRSDGRMRRQPERWPPCCIGSRASNCAPTLQSSDKRHLVRVFEIAAHGQATGNAGDAADVGFQPLGQIHGSGLALERRVRGDHDFLEAFAGPACLFGSLEERTNLQALRTHAVDRRDGAMKNVIEPLELTRPRQGQDVKRLLNHAQTGRVPPGVGADGAYRPVADVEAALAENDLLTNGNQCRGQGSSFCLRSTQQVERQPRGRLRTDAGQASEGFDESSNRLDQ